MSGRLASKIFEPYNTDEILYTVPSNRNVTAYSILYETHEHRDSVISIVVQNPQLTTSTYYESNPYSNVVVSETITTVANTIQDSTSLRKEFLRQGAGFSSWPDGYDDFDIVVVPISSTTNIYISQDQKRIWSAANNEWKSATSGYSYQFVINLDNELTGNFVVFETLDSDPSTDIRVLDQSTFERTGGAWTPSTTSRPQVLAGAAGNCQFTLWNNQIVAQNGETNATINAVTPITTDSVVTTEWVTHDASYSAPPPNGLDSSVIMYAIDGEEWSGYFPLENRWYAVDGSTATGGLSDSGVGLETRATMSDTNWDQYGLVAYPAGGDDVIRVRVFSANTSFTNNFAGISTTQIQESLTNFTSLDSPSVPWKDSNGNWRGRDSNGRNYIDAITPGTFEEITYNWTTPATYFNDPLAISWTVQPTLHYQCDDSACLLDISPCTLSANIYATGIYSTYFVTNHSSQGPAEAFQVPTSISTGGLYSLNILRDITENDVDLKTGYSEISNSAVIEHIPTSYKGEISGRLLQPDDSVIITCNLPIKVSIIGIEE